MMKQHLHRICAVILSLSLSLAFSRIPAYGLDSLTQWNLSDDGFGIGVQAAWNRGLDGSGVRIALIDSGINADHEALENVNIEQGYNVMEENTDTTDHYGHGTIIAGLIAANTQNHFGVRGICSGVTIVPIKCFDSSTTDVRYVVTGIYQAVDKFHCDVINLSLGVSADTQALREAVDYAAAQGVIIVSAVGNSGETAPNQLLYPAAYDTVIGVGAHGQNGEVCAFSHVNNSVFVTAPGEALYSLDADSADGIRSVSGTSFAAAQVSAMAVLAKSRVPQLTAAQFQELLKSSAVDAGPAGYDLAYGYGRVSIPRLLQAMDDLPEYWDIAGHWARENIEYCSERGFLSGTGRGVFSPDMTLTRAMAVSILWRIAGSPAAQENIHFSDVEPSSWYAAAVHWAANNGIVSGYGDDRFGSDDPVTREQLAVFFYRYASSQMPFQPADIPGGYTDWEEISPYAADAFSWAIANGIMRGKTNTAIFPQGLATRAEAATILRNFLTAFPVR